MCVAANAGAGRQIDCHAQGRTAVIGRIDASTTVQQIRACATFQVIVAAAADQIFVRRSTRNRIGKSRTDHPFDGQQYVAGRLAAKTGRSVEHHGDAAAGCTVVGCVPTCAAVDYVSACAAFDKVIAIATDQGVVVGATAQRVVASATFQLIGIVAACQGIVKGRTDDGFDAGQHVALCIAAGSGGSIQCDSHARAGVGIVGGIDAQSAVDHVGARAAVKNVAAFAALQGVDACAARQTVVAIAADQRVVTGIAGQRIRSAAAFQYFVGADAGDGVGIFGAENTFDITDGVARRIAALADAAVEDKGDTAGAGGIVRDVEACPAVQNVRACTSGQAVIASAARKAVGIVATDKRIVEAGSDNGFDADQRIACGMAARSVARAQIDRYACIGGTIVGSVETGTAFQRVGTGKAGQAIVAALAAQDVIFGRTVQRIGKGRSGNPLDVCEAVACRVAARVGATVQSYNDGCVGQAVIRDVDARAAVQRVSAAAALQHVIALSTFKSVAADTAGDTVVEGGTDNALDLRQAVALRVAAQADGSVIGNDHVRCRLRIVRRVEACAADQFVTAKAATQHIVACAAGQAVRAVIADQFVIECRSGDTFDTCQAIACSIAAGAERSVQRDSYTAGRSRIIRDVEAHAAVEDVGACPTRKRIIAFAARQPVDPGVTRQAVIVVGAGQIFDTVEAVALRRTAGCRTCDKAGGYRRARIAVVGRVTACAADEGVCTLTAAQQVVAIPAFQCVVAAVADDRVGISAADHALHTGNLVAFGFVARRGIAIQPNSDCALCRRIVDGVETIFALQLVCTGPADEDIVAEAAPEHVVLIVAGQAVIMVGADQALDAGKYIALCVSADAGRSIQSHSHARSRPAIIGCVGAFPALQNVCARATCEDIVAATAFKPIVASTADQAIVEGRANHALDALQHVAIGVAAFGKSAVETYRHGKARQAVIDGIVTRAAVQRVCAAQTEQRVVSIITQQDVRSGGADQRIVEPRSFQSFDADEHIADRIATFQRGAVQRHANAARRAVVAGDIETVAAIQSVGTRAAFDHIVAKAALERLRPYAANQAVAEIRTRQIFDIAVTVAFCVAARSGTPIQEDGDAYGAVAEIDRVCARAAIDRIRACAALKNIVARVADERVVEAGAGERFDVAQYVALCIAADAGRSTQRHLHASTSAGIIRDVKTCAAVQSIGTAAALQNIVACATVQLLIGSTADKNIRTACADDMLDADQLIAFGFAAVRSGSIEMDFDAFAILSDHDLRIIDRVRACATVDTVGTGAAIEAVIASVTRQIVVIGRACEPFDIGVGVAACISARSRSGGKIGLHAHIGLRVADDVDTRTAVDLVFASTCNDAIIAIACGDDGARRVGEKSIDWIAADRIGNDHIRSAVDDLDTEMGGDFDAVGTVLPVGRQAKLNRQEEFILKAAGRRSLALCRDIVNKTDIEGEMRLVCRQRHGFSRGIDSGGQLGNVACVNRDQPSLVGLRGVGDGIARRQGRDQNRQQRQILGRNHRFDMQNAQGRAGRRYRWIVGIDGVVSCRSADLFLGRLRAIAGVLCRSGATCGTAHDGFPGFGAGFHAFLVEQGEFKLRHQLANAGLANRIIRRRLDGARRWRAGGGTGTGGRVADLLRQTARVFIGLVLVVFLGRRVGLRLGGIGGLNASGVLVLFACRLLRRFLVGAGRRQSEFYGRRLFLDFADAVHGRFGRHGLVLEHQLRIATGKHSKCHAGDNDLRAVFKQQDDIDIDNFCFERAEEAFQHGTTIVAQIDNLGIAIIGHALCDVHVDICGHFGGMRDRLFDNGTLAAPSRTAFNPGHRAKFLFVQIQPIRRRV